MWIATRIHRRGNLRGRGAESILTASRRRVHLPVAAGGRRTPVVWQGHRSVAMRCREVLVGWFGVGPIGWGLSASGKECSLLYSSKSARCAPPQALPPQGAPPPPLCTTRTRRLARVRMPRPSLLLVTPSPAVAARPRRWISRHCGLHGSVERPSIAGAKRGPPIPFGLMRGRAPRLTSPPGSSPCLSSLLDAQEGSKYV